MLSQRTITRSRSLTSHWVHQILFLSSFAAGFACQPPNASAANRDEIRFRRMLVGKDDGPRIMAIQSVSQGFQTRAEALPIVIESLSKLSRDPLYKRAQKRGIPNLPDGIAMMIDFIGTVEQPEATEALVEVFESGHLYWVIAAVNSLCKNQHHEAIDSVSALMESEYFDESYGFRFTLARGLRQMKHPKGWEALASLYDLVDGQLAHRCREEFRAVTLEEFEGNEERFQFWRGRVGLSNPEPRDAAGVPVDADKMKLPEKFTFGPSKTAAGYLRERHLTPSKYYGIEIYARRLLFVLDRSGSMNAPTAYHTRLRRAKEELITAINGLDERCEFGILVFDTDVRAWKETLIEATEENKIEAVRYVQKLSAGRSTNTYGALRRSIEFDPQLEAVFILTDGQPTTGVITNPSSILQDILRRNETRHITINTIAIAVDPMIQGFLEKLTIPSQGEFKRVR